MWSDIVKTPKCSSLAENMCFGLVLIGQEMQPGRVLKKAKKKKKKEKEKKLRDVTYNVCAQTTYLALPHQSCRVGWGPGRSQPCQVSSKLVKGFGSLTS